jgi:hypothetical protein
MMEYLCILAEQLIEFLNKDYEGIWLGRGGPVALPTQSLDLNPLISMGLHEVESVSWW